jgi:homoserine kinase
LRFVIATPFTGLATKKARAALPPTISRKDAVFNLQHVLSLVHALQNGEYDRLREALRDRWHQPARAALVPHLNAVLAIDDPDVLGAYLRAPVPRSPWWRVVTSRGLNGCCRPRARLPGRL